MLNSSKFIKISAVLVLLATVASSEVLDTVNRQPVPEWQWNVNNNGELKITLPGNNYTLATKMSYPNMTVGAWNAIPGKKVDVKRDEDETTVDFKCDFYSMHRTIERIDERLVVRDTFQNLTKEDLAIAFDNILTAANASGTDKIWLAGSPTPNSKPCPDSPASNSSIFFAYPKGALGLVVEDDFGKLQAELQKTAQSGIVRNRSFALGPEDNYTFEYSFYPTGKGDYWDFINRVRRCWGVNSKVEGNMIFCNCPHPQWASYLPKEIQNALINYLGAKYVSGTNYFWLGDHDNKHTTPELMDKEYGSIDQQVGRLKAANKKAKAASPNLDVFARIQTLLCGPSQIKGKPIPCEDSIVILEDGKPKGKALKDKDGNEIGYDFRHYPTLDNSFYKYLTELVNKAMDAGIKVIYFDTFTYAIWSYYARWTYDRWDGHTVDINQENWTIARKKADLAILTSDAQVALHELITSRGGTMIFNGTPITRKQISLLATSQSFTEAMAPALAQGQHVGTPLNLGYTPGYGYRKDAWKTPKDYYENVMDNLNYGCLTYIYWLVSKLPDAPTIYQRMFPLTVKNIYAGCVEGEERIVTNRSGRYSFGDASEPKIYVYDKEGVESTPTAEQAKCERVNGKVIVTLTLPEGGAAVLEKQSAVADCLKNEL